MRRAIIALAAVAAFVPAASAQAADVQQDICVTTWHHIGEVCTSQLDDYAKAIATCVATREDKLSCVPNIGQRTTATSRSCSQPFEGSPCLENVVCDAVGNVVQRLERYGVDPSLVNCIH